MHACMPPDERMSKCASFHGLCSSFTYELGRAHGRLTCSYVANRQHTARLHGLETHELSHGARIVLTTHTFA